MPTMVLSVAGCGGVAHSTRRQVEDLQRQAVSVGFGADSGRGYSPALRSRAVQTDGCKGTGRRDAPPTRDKYRTARPHAPKHCAMWSSVEGRPVRAHWNHHSAFAAS